jgi:hypothetical protein
VTRVNKQLGWAWIGLAAALALHVADEALTGFLSVYNPTAMEIRSRIAWLPVPVFDFNTWLAGLIAGIALLFAASAFVFRGHRWIRPLAYALGVLMTANAAGHVLGTVAGRTFEHIQFARPMPGFFSSPVLAAASIWLLVCLRRTA